MNSSNGNNNDQQIYWDIQLDQDLLETIINIYPEWFQEENIIAMTEDSKQTLIPLLQNRDSKSPPKSEVDDASIKKAMDKNKESLKVKLMLRRPISQLIEQGIIPPLKTPPAFYEQRKKLERAKMGDYLKHKIQRRPQRQELIEQHILEETSIDPSLHEKQRQLKKARLADDLNDRLSQRPGPLELIKGNILHTDETFEQAVKEGQIHFKRTCEGEPIKHPPPRFTIEEESSSDSASSLQANNKADQSQSNIQPEGTDDVASSPTTTSSGSSNLSYLVSTNLPNFIASPPVHSFVLGNAVTIAAPTTTTVVVTSTPATQILNNTMTQPICQVATSNTIGNSNSQVKETSSGKSRKKAKSKSQPKTRTIKFHEYKGPPNANKSQNSSNASSTETSYELLLQQQQLFLQWQLEWQQKYPQILLPAVNKQNTDQDQGTNNKNGNSHAQVNSLQFKSINQNRTNETNKGTSSVMIPQNNSPLVGKIISKLEDMKVSDLKAELKKRHLPVSGAKQQLIDRLKPYTDCVMANASNLSNNNSSLKICGEVGEIKQNDSGSPTAQTNQLEKSLNKNDTTEIPMSPDVMSPDASSIVMKTENFSDNRSVAEKSPVSDMEIDQVKMENDIEIHHPNEALINEETSSSSSSSSREDILRLQQQKIAELQKELEKSQIQLKFQQIPSFSSDSQSVTMPINSQTQIHLVTTPNSVMNRVNVTSKNVQRHILQQHLQQKIQQQQIAQAQQQQQQHYTIPMIANELISPSSKANLAILQGHQQQQSATIPTVMLNTSNGQTLQHLVLCPTLCTTDTNDSTFEQINLDALKTRNNSLPNGIPQKLISQRTSSLPNFSTLISNQQATFKSPTDHLQPTVQQQNTHFVNNKPPPDYDEATKRNNKDKKKYVKSQAVDDVLEILIKNGELPPSAAQEPQTPEKSPGIKNLMSIFPNSNINGNVNLIQNENKAQTNPESNGFNNNNTTLDFDFILDLAEGLNETSDLGNSIQDKHLKQDRINNNTINSINYNNKVTIPSDDLSMSEFMDFQNECPLNVDDADWLEITNTQNNTNDVPSNFSLNNQVNNGKVFTSSHHPSLSLSSSSKHDPILPNTMLGGNIVDSLGDLFFDENDFKTSVDLGTLVWDKVDFAT